MIEKAKLADSPSPLHHSAIGYLQGKYGKGVIQYLGLQFASLEHRFAEPQVKTYSGSEVIDATRHGPPALYPADSASIEMNFIQKQIPTLDVPPISDINCLNLNITVPIGGGKDLPVLVYIHGGGFTFGSSSYPHYDQSKVVELSAIMDQKVVAVNFNYRLGIAGFLSSVELRGAGYKDNRGLLDQRAALEWVRMYISGFGGNPEKITVVGQSAGAASVNFLMHSEKRLFHQALLFGGSFLMMKPSTSDSAEGLYKAVIQALGLDHLPSHDRIEALLRIPQELLVAQISKEMVSLGPVIDGILVPTEAKFSRLIDPTELSVPGFQWCKRLFSIESQHDGTIFALVNLNFRQIGIRRAFSDYVSERLGGFGAKFLDFYAISEHTTDLDALESITQFISDIAFFAPSVKLAEAWPGKAYLGHFNERNPWNGRYEGKANHLLDIAFLWGNYNQSYTSQNWTVARAMAENVISFTCEKDHLPEYDPETKRATVYGPSGENIASCIVTEGSDDTRRNSNILQLADEAGGLDILLDMIHGFLNN